MKLQKFPKLDAHEVHIWSACLFEDKSNMDYFYSILSKDERERANDFVFIKNQSQFIVARGILRCLLSHYLEQPPESIEFVYGLYGKPRLSEDKSLHFNLSHSKDYALYAVTRNYEVGIDLEYIDKNLPLEDMAIHLFSDSKLDEWNILNSQERVNAFFKHWVSKEAFLKASGKGWLEDKEIQSDFFFNRKNEFEKKNLADEITNLYYFECIPNYASALFIEGNILPFFHYSWSQGPWKSSS